MELRGAGFLGHSYRRIRLRMITVTALAAGAFAGYAQTSQPVLTDEVVEDAINRGVRFIKSQRNADGNWEPFKDTKDKHWGGTTGLAVLSLLYANQDPRDDFMQRSLDWLAGQTLNGTYAFGVRAHAFSLLKAGASRYRLQDDLKWLLDNVWSRDSQNPGCYGYEAPEKGAAGGYWDNSASQFGVLGVWMAAETGLEVPDIYWESVGQHWLKYQNRDGGWGYLERKPSTGSMTAAGLASLFVVLDRRYADRMKDAGGLVSAIDAGLSWLGREFAVDTNPHDEGGPRWLYYYLYGVERAGRASGYKFFGQHDWFREGADYLLTAQSDDGKWDTSGGDMDPLRNTAFAVMFLCHGRAPLLFNKLQHDADWNAKLRDVAGLARFASRALERLLNWQIVRLDAPVEDLMEAPILYLCGESKWQFTDAEVQKLREYVQRGGLIFAVAGRDSVEFTNSIRDLAARALPEYPLRPLPDGHPLFSGEANYAIDKPPLILEANNGYRTLLLLSQRDLAAAWNRGVARASTERDLQLGTNVYLYATDKTASRSRLQTPNIPLRSTPTERTVKLACLKYDGKWDVEPYVWTRLRRYMQNETGTLLLVTSGVPLDSDTLGEFRVAHISGPGAFELTPDEVKGLRKFLDNGGTLLADAVNGSREFTATLEKYLGQVTQGQPQPLGTKSFILSGDTLPGGTDLGGTEFRRAVRSTGSGRKYPQLRAYGSQRRLVAIYSPLDLTVSLLGTPVFGLQGYESASALKIMRNLILYGDLTPAEKARLHRGEEP